MNIVIKIENTERQRVTWGGGVDFPIFRALENHCEQRFASKLKKANRKFVLPLYVYCLEKTGVDAPAARRRLNLSRTTWYRMKIAGEEIATKTQRGKKFYNEIMKVIRQVVIKSKSFSFYD